MTSAEIVVRIAAAQAGVDAQAVMGLSRRPYLARVRQRAMYVLRRLRPHLSYPAIGRAFFRDHSTVIHACSVMEVEIRRDPAEAAAVEALQATAEPLLADRPSAQELRTIAALHAAQAVEPAPRRPDPSPRRASADEPKCRVDEIEPGRSPPADWDRWLFEPYAERKVRLAAGREGSAP